MMKDSAKGRASVRLLALCLGTSGALIAPSAALGADIGTGGTVRATIGDNGAVKSVQQVGTNGATSAFSGQLPVKMTIGHTGQTYTYHVENTFTKTQTVHFTDTAGNDRHTTVALQLPLVAQLGVDVPASMTNLNATGATVTTGANGVRHLLWNMVLFTPLGSSAADVSFTAAGNGTPVAELRATPVDPSTAPGLSAKTQDKTAEFQQEDFWANYAGGGNDGLNQLADGANQMIVGLGQLLSGLKTGVSGANQLADGSAQAHSGSVDLRNGLKQIHDGLADTPDGLTGGMRLIDSGLQQVADKSAGLPAAVAGLKQIQAGVAASLAGVGDDTPGQTLISGTDQISSGLATAIDGVTSQLEAALTCVGDVEGGIVNGASAASIAADPCYATFAAAVTPFEIETTPGDPSTAMLPGAAAIDPNFATNPLYPVLLGLQQATAGMLTGVNANLNDSDPTVGLVAGLTALKTGADQLRFGLSHDAGTLGTSDPGGLKEGLTAINGGLLQLLDKKTGLPAAVSGVNQLVDGSGLELNGLEQELDGSGTAYDGSKKLASGLSQIATGNKQVADGLPPAVDGVTQLLDGSNQVHDGIVAVKTGATGPLQTQLTQASRNAHQQIAVLNAASALSAQAPGGAGTSYVLAQPGSIALAANTTASKSSSHTGRNAALIAIGGVLALAIGLGAGLAMGRQRVSA